MTETKYKINDAIVLNPNKIAQYQLLFNEAKKCDFKGTVKEIEDGSIYIVFSDDPEALSFGVYRDNILGYDFEYGEEIEVWDNHDNSLQKAIFINYNFDPYSESFYIKCENGCYTNFLYARRIEKKVKKDLTFEQIKERALAGNFWVKTENDDIYSVIGIGLEVFIITNNKNVNSVVFNSMFTELDGSDLKPLNEVE